MHLLHNSELRFPLTSSQHEKDVLKMWRYSRIENANSGTRMHESRHLFDASVLIGNLSLLGI